MIVIVYFPIAIVLLQVMAHFYSIISIYCQVAMVKKSMNVSTKQQPILDRVLSAIRERLDMGSIKNRECFFPSYRTTAIISLVTKILKLP